MYCVHVQEEQFYHQVSTTTPCSLRASIGSSWAQRPNAPLSQSPYLPVPGALKLYKIFSTTNRECSIGITRVLLPEPNSPYYQRVEKRAWSLPVLVKNMNITTDHFQHISPKLFHEPSPSTSHEDALFPLDLVIIVERLFFKKGCGVL